MSHLIEEYKEIRTLIQENEKRLAQVFTISLAVGVSILSALGTIYVRSSGEIDNFHFLFLLPSFIILPAQFMANSVRRNIFRAGTYLYVFVEPNLEDVGFETRLREFRKRRKEESFDLVPITFESLVVLCIFLFIVTSSDEMRFQLGNLVLPIIILIVMIIAHTQFAKASKLAYSKYLNFWREIEEQESKGSNNR